uniref:Uncharacterized protein n=1 Tax=Pyxicephalus adspersus TaxID=30357 RepID=A0AAV3AFR2_PYXAD|nr:TPA: hypothetical protein GDO54_009818 [Pyxicephalus adspersus]
MQGLQMARLGLLAAAFSSGHVEIYSLPHPESLQAHRKSQVKGRKQLTARAGVFHNFIVTCGADRNLKFWDLRRLVAPVNVFKRFQCTEVTWLLPYCGVVVAQDNCFAAFGLCGLHYVDSGFMGYKPYFAAPRRGTVWSVSGSDWLGTVTAGDITGEVMAILMPFLNVQSINTKRPADRRFVSMTGAPIYKANFLSTAPHVDGDIQSLSGGTLPKNTEYQHFKPKSFRAAASRAALLFQDTDLRDFHRITSREPTKRMRANETKGDVNMERVQLESIHKVRFSPNLDTYTWMVSAGHSGLIRVHCVRGLLSSFGQKMIQEKSAHFQATNHTNQSDCNPEGPV